MTDSLHAPALASSTAAVSDAAARWRLLPGPQLLPLLGLWTAAALALPWAGGLLPAWLAAGALLLALTLLEGLLLWRRRPPHLARQLPPSLPLGVWREVTLTLWQDAGRARRLQLADHLPAGSESDSAALNVTLPAGGALRLHYRLRANRRGTLHFPGIDLRQRGGLGLLSRQDFLPVASTVRVYPNFAEVAKYTLLASDNRLSQLGIRLRRRRGAGMEFHQLREYREGDALRQIDWKATSRLRKLIAREYQDERDQQVMLLLDGGFRMRSQDGRLSHFDEALNALLLLTYSVQRQGDAVGLMTFANRELLLPPAKGRDVMNRFMNAVFDMEPSGQTPDFAGLATRLETQVRKRSLLILITSLRDEDTAELADACQRLGERHLVLVANLREKVLDDIDQQAPADVDTALTVAATHRYLAARERALAGLRHQGVIVLDVLPEQLAVGLINRYLEIKRSGRL